MNSSQAIAPARSVPDADPLRPQSLSAKLTRAESARINGAKSRGPHSEAGKARSRCNAFKHGLYGKTLTRQDEPLTPEARAFIAVRVAGYQPENPHDQALATQLATLRWHINQVVLLQSFLVQQEVEKQAGLHPRDDGHALLGRACLVVFKGKTALTAAMAREVSLHREYQAAELAWQDAQNLKRTQKSLQIKPDLLVAGRPICGKPSLALTASPAVEPAVPVEPTRMEAPSSNPEKNFKRTQKSLQIKELHRVAHGPILWKTQHACGTQAIPQRPPNRPPPLPTAKLIWMPSEPAGLLQLIATAVTPVVMISATATLILGINNKHQSMADRLRNLAAEFRVPATTEARRRVIQQQMHWFLRRIRYAAAAHRLLYAAIVLFLVTILLIIVAPARLTWTPAAYAAFLAGVLFMLAAAAFEFLELWWTNLTLRLEMEDVLASTTPAKEPATRG